VNLSDIYEYIYHKCYSECSGSINEYKAYFLASDISPNNILDTIKDRFVFLDPGEIYSESYNLIGFQLVGGNFTFTINKNSLKDYVYTEPIWDNNQSKYMEIKTELPIEVGNYKLYYGNFCSNEISLNF